MWHKFRERSECFEINRADSDKRTDREASKFVTRRAVGVRNRARANSWNIELESGSRSGLRGISEILQETAPAISSIRSNGRTATIRLKAHVFLSKKQIVQWFRRNDATRRRSIKRNRQQREIHRILMTRLLTTLIIAENIFLYYSRGQRRDETACYK